MLVIAAQPQFKQMGEVDLGEASRSTPAVANGLMLIRTDSRLRAHPQSISPHALWLGKNLLK